MMAVALTLIISCIQSQIVVINDGVTSDENLRIESKKYKLCLLDFGYANFGPKPFGKTIKGEVFIGGGYCNDDENVDINTSFFDNDLSDPDKSVIILASL